MVKLLLIEPSSLFVFGAGESEIQRERSRGASSTRPLEILSWNLVKPNDQSIREDRLDNAPRRYSISEIIGCYPRCTARAREDMRFNEDSVARPVQLVQEGIASRGAEMGKQGAERTFIRSILIGVWLQL